MILWFYLLSIALIAFSFCVLFLPFSRTILIECDNGEVFPLRSITSIVDKALGLSFRKKLKEDGLLFIFRDSYPKAIWNIGVRFPFDVFWIAEDGEVLGKVLDIKPPRSFSDIKAWTSPKNCRFVLEVPTSSKNRDLLLKCAKIKINQN